MGCRKDSKKHKLKPAKFRCKKCGAFARKSKQICKPKRVGD